MARMSIRWWEEVLSFKVTDMPLNLKEFKETVASYRCTIRKITIIANHYLMENERLVYRILKSSAFPAEDVGATLDMCHPEAYRMISYVKVLLKEFYSYFEKKTYKKLPLILPTILPSNLYAVLHVHAVCRNSRVTAEMLGYSPKYIKRLLDKVDVILKKYSLYNKAVRDLFIAWRRIHKVRKTNFSWYAKYLVKDYIEHGGKTIKSIRDKWGTGDKKSRWYPRNKKYVKNKKRSKK